MVELFKQYGETIITIVVVVALVAILGIIVAVDGPIHEAILTLVNDLLSKAIETPSIS